MPLTRFSGDDFKNHFRALGLKKGDNVILHSKLASFGLVPSGPETAFSALRRVIGEKATIVVPTYCFHLTVDDIYDPKTTASINMGVISEYVRRLPFAYRSPCPIHNHSAVGDLAPELTLIKGDVSFGPKSDFEWLSNHDFKLVLLGCGLFEAGTQAFHAMACSGVPYRDWLNLSRKYLDRSGEVKATKVRYYSRMNQEIEDITIPKRILNDMNKIVTIKAPVGASNAMKLRDYRKVCDDLLKKNPSAFLKSSKQ